MESSKANTVGIAKNSPSLRIRKTLQFFRACSGLLFFPKNGKDGINHPLLPELPYLRTKPKTQVQQGGTYLSSRSIYGIIPPIISARLD